MEHILLPEKYPGFLERFTKSQYGGSFKDYCEMTAPYFDELELCPEGAANAAVRFVDSVENSLPRLFGRKLAIYDICRFLFLYTVPASLGRKTDAGNSFADALVAEWNRRFTNDTLSKAGFSEINSGFKTRIMGFDIGRD